MCSLQVMVYDQDEFPSMQQYGFRVSPGLVNQVVVNSERVSLHTHTKYSFFFKHIRDPREIIAYVSLLVSACLKKLCLLV